MGNIPIAIFILLPIFLLLRYVNHLANPEFETITHLFPSHLRMDSLLFGVLIAYYFYFEEDKLRHFAEKYKGLLITAGLVMLTPAFIWHKKNALIHSLGLSLFYIGNGAIIIGCLYLKIPNNMISRSICYLGTHSYSIYLWHIPVIIWMVGTNSILVDQI